jgi:iron complex outermembrane recepter protein
VGRFITTAMLLFIFIPCATISKAQVCNNTIIGTVLDAGRHPVAGAIIQVDSMASLGAVTDTAGAFSISNVCKGHLLLICNATGYKHAIAHIDVTNNTHVAFTLTNDNNQLQEVVVNGVRLQDLHTVTQTELQGLQLLQARGSSLGEALKEMPGMNSIQTGPSLSKPVIHGLHSNRVLLLNNGVRQEGQQWGSEHAPEIDPFVANRITVVKGAASVRYGSDAIAGVVLLDPDPLPAQKGLSGDAYLVGATNGQMGAASASVQGAFDKKLTGLAWRLQGTFKKAGNFSTPGYYLKNTGLEESDGSAAIGYRWRGLDITSYFSIFYTKNGIFDGAHVGNLTDLYAAFNRDKPITASVFSYDINRSYQNVYHDLFKTNASYHFANEGKLEVNFARQKDLREEYDIDLPFSTDPDVLKKPQVSFQLITHSIDLAYIEPTHNGFSGSIGASGNTQGNVFKGIRYLIPNFRNYSGGAFAIERYSFKKFTFEAGIRYDYRWLKVYQLNSNTLQTYNSSYNYENFTASIGAIYRASEKLSINLNTGTAWRAPSINELFIHGVHFSDASYQNGDSTLHSERSLNTSLSVNYQGKKLRVVVDLYDNNISNYIYEKPQLQPVTLISGTYPAFQFTQDNVNISGLDALLQYDIVSYLTFQSKATIVRGYNLTQHTDLIYMPADRFENGITYNMHNYRKIEEPYISLEDVAVLKQTRVPANSDYVAPPAGYNLINMSVGCAFPVRGKKVHIDFSVKNLANVAYRDYLNHFRYYANDLGINFMIRTKISF